MQRVLLLSVAGVLLAGSVSAQSGGTTAAPEDQPPLSPAVPCAEWNLASDFRTWPNQENPNRDACGNPDVWHYLYSPTLTRDPASYRLLPAFVPNGDDVYPVWGLNNWAWAPGTAFPFAGVNATGVAQHVWTYVWPAGAVNVHPYPSRIGIVGWRAPTGGTVAMTGTVRDMDSACGDGVSWYIDHAGSELASGSVNRSAQTFDLAVAVAPGDLVYFVIHPGPRADHICDSTQLDVRIRPAAVPLALLRLAQPLIAGCLKTSGKVKLVAPAPAGGLTVALHSDNPNVVVPASLTFKAGVQAKSFAILTNPVAERQSATIEASVPGQVLSAVQTIKPIGPKSLTLLPNPVGGGNLVAGSVMLQCPAAPGDIVVNLSSSTSSVAAPTVASVTVPAGTRTMPFDVTTATVDRVRKPSIIAVANGVKRLKTLTVNPVP